MRQDKSDGLIKFKITTFDRDALITRITAPSNYDVKS